MSNDGILIYIKERNVYANPAAIKLLRRTLEDLEKTPALDILEFPDARTAEESENFGKSPPENPQSAVLRAGDGAAIRVRARRLTIQWEGEEAVLYSLQEIPEPPSNPSSRPTTPKDGTPSLDNLLQKASIVLYSCAYRNDNFTPSYASSNIQELFGWSQEEYLRNPNWWAENIHPQDREKILETFQREIMSKGSVMHTYRFRRKDGSYAWVHDEVRLEKNAKGEPLGITGTWSDARDRREKEKELILYREQLEELVEARTRELYRSEARQAQLLAASPTIVYARSVELDGKLNYVSKNAKTGMLLDYSFFMEEGFSFLKRIHPEDRYLMEEAFAALLSEDGMTLEYRFQRGDGVYIWLRDEAHLSRNAETGRPLEIIGAWTDITERKIAELKLQKARDESDSANRAKSEFLSRMSHELRTPLNAVLGFSQLLDSDRKEPLNETQRKYVTEILNAGYHLLDLINEILDLARIEAGRVAVRMEDVSLREICEECKALILPQANRRKIRIEDQTEDVKVFADRKRLKQIVLNLMSNAVKYNREEGLIEIRTSRHNDGIRLLIRDSGEGISAEDIKRLFQPFERLQPRENIEGTGIGLLISKNLTEMMNGRIGVESEPGKGSVFWVELKAATDS